MVGPLKRILLFSCDFHNFLFKDKVCMYFIFHDMPKLFLYLYRVFEGNSH